MKVCLFEVQLNRLIFCSNETQYVCRFIFKTTWKPHFKYNENNWKFTKEPVNIMECCQSG